MIARTQASLSRPLACAAALTLGAALVNCGGGYSSGSGGLGPPPPHDVTIQQQASTLGNGAFSPDTLSASLAAGGSVIWYNGDVGGGVYGGSGTTHHMVSDVSGVFDTGTIGPGATGTATFASQGPVAYHCSIHPTMVGVINVGP